MTLPLYFGLALPYAKISFHFHNLILEEHLLSNATFCLDELFGVITYSTHVNLNQS